MCGIIGYIGSEPCVEILVDGLKRLEYRGYDSAGIAFFRENKFQIVKSEGRIANLEAKIGAQEIHAVVGMGHTRWATHGRPNDVNAHPHRAGKVTIVHNGIVENDLELKDLLISKQCKILSETDSELLAHLIQLEKEAGVSLLKAVQSAFQKVRGSCTAVVVHDDYPDQLIAVKNGTPLIVAKAKNNSGVLVASDAQALAAHADAVTVLENGDIVVCTKENFLVYELNSDLSQQVERSQMKMQFDSAMVEKNGYEHFMLKEIFEQPRALIDSAEACDPATLREQFKDIDLVYLVGCGTAWHACLIGKYLLEKVLTTPVLVDLASEFRYREPTVTNRTLFLAVSQSGETADTLAALKEAKEKGARTIAICNVRGSTLSREAQLTIFTNAGPEIGVASTKAFTTQVSIFMQIQVALSRKSPTNALTNLATLPHLVQQILDQAADIKEAVAQCNQFRGFLFIGRGYLFPVALEGALKLKEISYLHAEGYPAGELKHGPIALIDSAMVVVAVISKNALYEKSLSNLQEVKARGAFVVTIGDAGNVELAKMSNIFIPIPFCHDERDVILASIPLQLFSYYMAVMQGRDVDRPRNLAKSVTVE